MSFILKLIALGLGLVVSSQAIALSLPEAKHLLGRTGFQPSFSEIQPYLKLTKQQAVDQRVNEINSSSRIPLDHSLKTPYIQKFDFKSASRKERIEFNKLKRQRMKSLQQWWFEEMRSTPSPFTENLTLFWHNHFVTSAKKVRDPEFMAMQNVMLRRNAAGNFGTFLHDVLKDPAMLRYLDNQRNLKNKPNENLARELLELFTLGEGNYVESDIKIVSKILSGSTFDRATGVYKFNPKYHDKSEKNLWEKTGRLLPKDLVELILGKPETANFITKKLWAHFITTPISNNNLKKLAASFRKNYDLKILIAQILKQPEFWNPENQGSKIKSPISLIVGLYRQFEIAPGNPEQVLRLATNMQQNILYPPNVKGWNTGEAWINSNTLLLRQNFLQSQTRGMKLINKIINKPHADWQALLIGTQVPDTKIFKELDEPDEIRQKINDILLMPEYQMQ